MHKILISGASSGLGKFLLSSFKADQYDREALKPKNNDFPRTGYEIIIHVAFNMPNNHETEIDYKNSHLKLADNLLSIPHRKFILISSVDVVKEKVKSNWYGEAKLDVENLCLQKGTNPIILRCGAMFGPSMRKNQMLKIALGDNIKLTLARSSKFYLISYEDVASLVKKKLVTGKYYLISKKLVSLSEVAEYFGQMPEWGSHEYTPPQLDPEIKILYPITQLSKDPLKWLREFIENNDWK